MTITRAFAILIAAMMFILGCEPGTTSTDRSDHPDRDGSRPAPQLALSEQIALIERGESTAVRISQSVTDADVERLSQLTAITQLVLNGSQIGDAGVASLAELPNLELLRIESRHVTDTGLVSIGKSRTLRFLILHDASITDQGLLHLKAMSQLESLYLVDTPITDAGAAGLMEHLPRLHIHWLAEHHAEHH